MKRLAFFLLLTACCSLLTVAAQTKDYAKWVNPFIGTGGHGHTFPGATMPFGMVQLSPDTRIDNWDGSSGYHYSDDTIFGFSHTHLSGTGIPDYCDILFMPTVGDAPRSVDSKDTASSFSHANEKAEPGYYSVKLNNGGIFAELTATRRVGLHRYTFPQSDQANIILDLTWRDKVLGVQAKVVGDRRVEGFRRSSSWAKNQTVYFVAEFSVPFLKTDIDLMIDKSTSAVGGTAEEATSYRRSFRFMTKENQPILVKVAISSVSVEGARKNLAAELPGWNFEKVRADARGAWNKELSKIEVSGGTDAQTTTFYTALYHTMIQPNVFNDVDGSYLGHDKKIHNIANDGVSGTLQKPARKQGRNSQRSNYALPNSRASASDNYTVFSLWDTFRAAHPLYTIIDQKRTVDFINTFIRQYEEGGRLPVWELWGEETDTMIGYHAVSVIADAMAKGIKGFDYEKAYAAAKHSAELDHFGLAAYKRRGYISMEDENESVSKTLEYAYDDWCIAQIAKLTMIDSLKGATPREIDVILHSPTDAIKTRFTQSWYAKKADYDRYLQRSRYFENLFDPETGFMRPKKNGGFVAPFAPNEVTFNYTEGNAWVYSFFVPQDIEGLISLMGGQYKFSKKLDELFSTKDKLAGREQPDITGLIGQYAHGNEPSHHIAYLYDYAGQPWKTQKLVRKIMDEFYKPEPDGLIGNEDCGQMSAWYILSASGFYPVTPGNGEYAFGTPLFHEMTYRLENGKTFTVRAKNVSATNKYILNAKLNGAQYKKAFITHADIMKGGILEFAMVDTPVTTAFTEFPVSATGSKSIAVPIIEGDSRVFNEKAAIKLQCPTKGTLPFYSTDGRDNFIKMYERPINIGETTTIKAICVDENRDESRISEAKFIKKPNDWTVNIASKYNRQYTGGGDEGLIDGIRGTVNFASGEWQGYQGKTFEAVIDLQGETEIKEVGGGFLQSARSWIWMPDRIEFEVSSDGSNFTKIADLKPAFPQTDMNTVTKDFVQSVTPTKARYVRVKAYNFGKIPSWHPGAGGDPWIFVDEIFIR